MSPNSLTYLNFPSSPTITIPAGTLFPDRDYKISCQVTNSASKQSEKTSTFVEAKSGEILEIKIESRYSKNGYLDYKAPSLFICETLFNETYLPIINATYSWKVTDSFGNEMALPVESQILNSLKLPANTFAAQKNYIFEVVVNYLSYTGRVAIRYSTVDNTEYSLIIEPSSGIGLQTDFTMAVLSQSSSFEVNKFSFGFWKGGQKYYLTKISHDQLQNVILPQGDTSDILIVFVEVNTEQVNSYYIQKLVTVTASILLPSAFNSLVNKTNVKSVEESVFVRLQYEHIRASLALEYKKKAIDIMLNGLLKDGSVA